MATRRVGVFGGSFDPIHLGHLILAEIARETLSLDQVLFVPAYVAPHKRPGAAASEKDRLEMIHLAIAGNPTFAVSDVELSRGGVSYTVDTLEALHSAHPSDEHYLLIGADNLPDLPRWYKPKRILELAHLAVAERPGFPPANFACLAEVEPSGDAGTNGRFVVPIPLIDISATTIRQRRAAGQTVRYLVPSAVLAYLESKALYLPWEETKGAGNV